MPAPFNTGIDLKGNEARRMRLHSLTADPTLAASDAGRVWFDSASSQFKGWTGTAVTRIGNIVEGVTGTGAIKAAAPDASKNIALSVDSASATIPGVMSAAHFSLLAGATPNNTASTLVQRDSSGNISFATATGSLTGTASNASALGGASLAQVRDFSQTTGQRDYQAISGFDARVQTSRLDQFAAPSAAVAMGSQRLTGLADPVNPQDAATKNYADSLAAGLDTKASVRAATTDPLPASTYANGSNGVGATLTASANGALGLIGNVSVVAGDRVLVKNQATAQQNGIYVVTNAGSGSAAWVLTRATDADTGAKLNAGAYTFVEEGTLVGSGWVMNGPNVVTIGSTALPWAQFTGGQSYSPGNGLTLAGSTFSVVGTTNRISVTASGVDIASTYVGQTSITTLGTIGTGTWQGNPVGVAYGGTGATSAAAARSNLGAAGIATVSVPAIAASGTVQITNPFNTKNCVVQFVNNSTDDVEIIDVNIKAAQITLTNGATAIAADAYRLNIIA